jgi:hypothetical protein
VLDGGGRCRTAAPGARLPGRPGARRRDALGQSWPQVLAGGDDVLDGDGGVAAGGGVVERLEREVGGAQVTAADLEQRVERALVERDAGGAGDGAAVGDVLASSSRDSRRSWA